MQRWFVEFWVASSPVKPSGPGSIGRSQELYNRDPGPRGLL